MNYEDLTKRCDCIFYEAEDIGGSYCRARDLYNEDIVCEDCESYDDGEKEGGEQQCKKH